MTEQLELNRVRNTRRGKLYGIFSSAFRSSIDLEKMRNFVETCSSDEGKNLSSLCGNFLTNSSEFTELKDYYLKAEKDQENEELKYKVEYTHLFLLPEGVHPYESVYRGKKKLLMDKPWEEVRKFYRRLGVIKDKDELHPEDHISTELGFMSFMSYLTLESLIEDKDIIVLVKLQVEFIENHLLKWVPQLKENIIENKYSDIYKPVILLVNDFINTDLEKLKEIITADNLA